MIKQLIDLTPVYEASQNMKGTNNYSKYFMETSALTNGRWHFIGWYPPFANEMATIKK